MSLERIPRSLIRKLEARAFPLRVLAGIREMRAYLEELEREAMLGARLMGASSADMADALGITRQGVHQKLKRLAPTSSSRVGPDSDRIVLPELEPEPD